MLAYLDLQLIVIGELGGGGVGHIARNVGGGHHVPLGEGGEGSAAKQTISFAMRENGRGVTYQESQA